VLNDSRAPNLGVSLAAARRLYNTEATAISRPRGAAPEEPNAIPWGGIHRAPVWLATRFSSGPKCLGHPLHGGRPRQKSGGRHCARWGLGCAGLPSSGVGLFLIARGLARKVRVDRPPAPRLRTGALPKGCCRRPTTRTGRPPRMHGPFPLCAAGCGFPRGRFSDALTMASSSLRPPGGCLGGSGLSRQTASCREGRS
jgi:hypothetical protein